MNTPTTTTSEPHYHFAASRFHVAACGYDGPYDNEAVGYTWDPIRIDCPDCLGATMRIEAWVAAKPDRIPRNAYDPVEWAARNPYRVPKRVANLRRVPTTNRRE